MQTQLWFASTRAARLAAHLAIVVPVIVIIGVAARSPSPSTSRTAKSSQPHSPICSATVAESSLRIGVLRRAFSLDR